MEKRDHNGPQPGLLADFLTPAELARELGVSPRTLARWQTLRQGPPRIKVGRRILFEGSAVRKWLADKTEQPLR